MSIADVPVVVPATDTAVPTVGLCGDTALKSVQAALLSEVLIPVLDRLHPNGDYFVGTGVEIDWRPAKPEHIHVRPDWFYAPHLTRLKDGYARHKYTFWEEPFRPWFVVDFIAGNDSLDRQTFPLADDRRCDQRTANATVYALWNAPQKRLEVYERWQRGYRLQPVAEDGRFATPEMKMSLGVWFGTYQGYTGHWLRAWDMEGRLLPTQQECADRLAARLRELGLDPDSV